MRIISDTYNRPTGKSYLQELESRLEHGEVVIRQYQAANKPVDRLVKHWLDLLHEYEQEFRQMQSAA